MRKRDGRKLSHGTLQEIRIRAVQRKEKVNHNPPSDFIIKQGDVMLFIGKREDINLAIEYLELARFI